MKKLLVCALLASAGSTYAYDDSLGPLVPLGSTFEVGVGFPAPTFLDTLSFTLSAPSEGSFTVAGQSVVIPGFFSLAAAKDLSFAIYKGGVDLTGFNTSFTGIGLLAGNDYSFKVKGLSGGYRVTWAVTPSVPEPESLAFVLAGLAVVATTARRRLGHSH